MSGNFTQESHLQVLSCLIYQQLFNSYWTLLKSSVDTRNSRMSMTQEIN